MGVNIEVKFTGENGLDLVVPVSGPGNWKLRTQTDFGYVLQGYNMHRELFILLNVDDWRVNIVTTIVAHGEGIFSRGVDLDPEADDFDDNYSNVVNEMLANLPYV